MILAEKISELRREQGWSQEELAEKLSVSRQSVSKWESGASIPDIERILKLSALFGVSTDYLLKDELEELSGTKPEPAVSCEEMKSRRVSLSEANTYMDLCERLSPRMALGVMLCVLSPVLFLAAGAVSDYGWLPVTREFAQMLGMVALFLLVASAVALFVLNGMKLSEYEYLEKEDFTLEYGVSSIVEKRKDAYQPVFRLNTALGVTLCILSVIPILISSVLAKDENVILLTVDLLLILVAAGVWLFVHSGMIYGSFQKLLQEGEYTPDKKRRNRGLLGAFAGGYWCIVTALYLFVSFRNHSFDTSWSIWPVAGVLFAAAYTILEAVLKAREKRAQF